jgi:hypothetical protein
VARKKKAPKAKPARQKVEPPGEAVEPPGEVAAPTGDAAGAEGRREATPTKSKKASKKDRARPKKASKQEAAENGVGTQGAPERKPVRRDSAEPESPEKAPSKKKRTPKTKRARKKVAKREAEVAPPPGIRADEPEEVVAVDLDDDSTEGRDELAAAAAALISDGPPQPESASAAEAKADEADVSVVDLDADLDEALEDDVGSAAAIAQLIAETVAGAPEAEPDTERDEPAIDLDEPPIGVDEAPIDADEPAAAAPGERPAAMRGVQPASAAELADDTADAVVPPVTPGIAAIDLGPVSTPEFRDRLLAQALAHAEHQDARYRVPFSNARSINRWKGLAASFVLLLALVVAVAPPAWVRPEPPVELSPAARGRAIRLGLLLQAQQVEAYRVRSQELPATLDDLSIRLPGVRYAKSGNRAFQLVAYEPDGNAIVYDSSNPAPPFRALADRWAVEEERR